MSDRETLHQTDVEGADEDITVGAHQWVHDIGGGKHPGAPTITLWAGGVEAWLDRDGGARATREPAGVRLPDYPRLLGNLLAALGEAARTAGPVDLDMMGDEELDTYTADLDTAVRAAIGQVTWLSRRHAAAVAAKARRENTRADAGHTAPA